MKVRVLALPLFMFASTASADTPPPNFSQQVYLCNSHLQAKVDITFSQTASTAAVQTQSGQVKDNPFVPGVENGLDYAVFVAASVKPSSTASWSTSSEQQDGLVGTPQDPIATGISTFKSSSCQIKGTVIISTGCPSASGMNRDYKTVERTWVGCGL